MYITNAECSGDPKHFDIWVISWHFEHFWANNWQGIKQFTQNDKIMIQWRKIISFDFHHIPKLSIGFNAPTNMVILFPPIWFSSTVICKNMSRKVRPLPIYESLQNHNAIIVLFQTPYREQKSWSHPEIKIIMSAVSDICTYSMNYK